MKSANEKAVCANHFRPTLKRTQRRASLTDMSKPETTKSKQTAPLGVARLVRSIIFGAAIIYPQIAAACSESCKDCADEANPLIGAFVYPLAMGFGGFIGLLIGHKFCLGEWPLFMENWLYRNGLNSRANVVAK